MKRASIFLFTAKKFWFFLITEKLWTDSVYYFNNEIHYFNNEPCILVINSLLETQLNKKDVLKGHDTEFSAKKTLKQNFNSNKSF